MLPEELVTIILGILGILLQLAFKYAPKFSVWYQAQANKGLLALAFSFAIGGLYYGLSCTPYAVELNIALACNQEGMFALLRAFFIIASTQQLTYLTTRK